MEPEVNLVDPCTDISERSWAAASPSATCPGKCVAGPGARCPLIVGSDPPPQSRPCLRAGPSIEESTVRACDPLGLDGKTVLLYGLALVPRTLLLCACAAQENTLEQTVARGPQGANVNNIYGHRFNLTGKSPTHFEWFLGSRGHFSPPENPTGHTLVRPQTRASLTLVGIKVPSGCTS